LLPERDKVFHKLILIVRECIGKHSVNKQKIIGKETAAKPFSGKLGNIEV